MKNAVFLVALLGFVGCSKAPEETFNVYGENGEVVKTVPKGEHPYAEELEDAKLVSDEVVADGVRMTVHETEDGKRIGTYSAEDGGPMIIGD